METTFKIMLILHATLGGISLISGLFAIFSKKGKKVHLKSGLIYFWAMMGVVLTGLFLGIYRNNIFILTIAVFSFYLVYTGRRTLAFKKAVSPEKKDWAISFLCLSIAFYMLYLALINGLRLGLVGAIPMLLVFGLILSWMCLQDLLVFRKKNYKKGAWLITHIGRMGGSYIATSTAFLVVNIHIQPAWIIWLLPTVVGTPMIVMASRSWAKKFKPKKVTA